MMNLDYPEGHLGGESTLPPTEAGEGTKNSADIGETLQSGEGSSHCG
jgi:hypothetical protein